MKVEWAVRLWLLILGIATWLTFAMLLTGCSRDKGASGMHQMFSLGTPSCNGGDVCREDK